MTHFTIWIISFLAIAGVIIRPFKVPEFIWALAGAIVLLITGLISPPEGLNGVGKGSDVYLFLTGMMLLAETAREEKLFDWLAAHATKMAKGSSGRLFLLIYLVGVVVTAFLSNDATAVVLTPAVAAAVKAAKVNKPLPYLFICAFIANAASFVLPISNPANLVIYGSHMPALLQWLHTYALPSAVAVIITYAMLYLTQRKNLNQAIESDISIPSLSTGGKTALIGIAATAVILLLSSAFDIQLGLPTAITGIITSAIVIIMAKKNPLVVIKGVSWSVLPLVAGLFVIVEALSKTGLIQNISTILQQSVARSVSGTVWGSGIITAFSCNFMNNLPAGLIAGNAVQAGHIPEMVKSAILIGIDLGPNLSITGSLATILWLVALRREGITVNAWTFLKLGFIVMTVALLFTIGALYI
ncbi:arsenic transporter [Mucilaginibacter dorajii]|uniref:Arsenic transporter n=1 Tax=Mucilaginibacter dorajii TaxID=692994 RepID=A0ABP7P742_9SPHI|nr:arsenic transporter [Mucilaginibacter dorajii]MCS3734576.1 arsenical pump membrane protein [Mucilaginibacter dorajii]